MNDQTQHRRGVLTKAMEAGDLVAELTAPRAPEAVGPLAQPTPQRRGPGRPRGRRRMEPFSSKIEISLRDDVDRYLAEHEETMVDLIDRALRAAISQSLT
ncbi:hypothetical protein KQI48_00340 [Cellulomonas hominis]|jgi:hypothetical protein|uniref:hypothetical protein n=1 Tax=Cellulomonas hominis TaxID=156981 RepID=UPI001C10E7A7|nr:hypothetical protein [Cellulomonas hominis]MBU5421105.1 hypothetical protein [Cellulomonas hominis]